MRRTGLVSLLAVALLFVGAQSASAQFHFGPQVGYGTDFDFSIGGKATLGFNTVLFEGTGPLTGSLAFDYFISCPGEDFGGDSFNCSYFNVVPAVFVPFGSSAGKPYAGAGLSYGNYSLDYDTGIPGFNPSFDGSEIGLAILGGYMFPLGSMTGMAEGRVGLGGYDQVVLTFALLFGGSN